MADRMDLRQSGRRACDLAERGHGWAMERWDPPITRQIDYVRISGLPGRVATAARVLVNGRVVEMLRSRIITVMVQ